MIKRRWQVSARKNILLLALVLDTLFGDPPNRFHPSAGMGKLIAYAMRFRPRGNPFAEFVFGTGIALSGSVLVTGIGKLLEKGLGKCYGGYRNLPCLVVEAAILKSTFSLRGLNKAAGEVQVALESGGLPTARRSLSWHLVSRDTSTLDEALVSAATIESVAENTSDGILAPLFFYLLGGLPLALVYRFINTADSLLGYHTPDMEWLGKASARLDDLLNFLPARLTGVSIVLAAPFVGGNTHRAWTVMRHEAHKTLSPNAGYPMSAMAGALNVELEKVGHYRLGTGGRRPGASDIHTARRAMLAATAIAVGFLLLLPFRNFGNKVSL